MQQFAAGGERHRKLLRAPDPFRRSREETLQQFADCRDAILMQPKFRTLKIGRMAQRLTLDAILGDPYEV